MCCITNRSTFYSFRVPFKTRFYGLIFLPPTLHNMEHTTMYPICTNFTISSIERRTLTLTDDWWAVYGANVHQFLFLFFSQPSKTSQRSDIYGYTSDTSVERDWKRRASRKRVLQTERKKGKLSSEAFWHARAFALLIVLVIRSWVARCAEISRGKYFWSFA